MGLWSWLTGHSPKESDVYANYDKVAVVTEELNNLGGTGVQNASIEVIHAIQKLNSVNGFSQFVGTIPTDGYVSMFESISESIIGISRGITSKAEGIKQFNESSIFEKLGSSACMGLFKAGEGLLSVGEGLVDSVASVVGWAGGLLGADGFRDDIANFVKKDFSHDIFNFYYNSDFAKSSLFTEDSAMAGAFKLVGQTVGYLYAGGVLAGMGSAAGLGTTSIGRLASGIASSTTWGATVASGLGGLGNVMESNLKLGLDYNTAMRGAAVAGAVQAGLAFAGGKLGEHLNKNAHIKNAPDQATADSFRAMKASQFQGYSDSITKAGQEFGKAQVTTAKAGVKALTANAKAATAGVRKLNPVETQTARSAAQTANATFKKEFSNLVKNANPLSQGVEGVRNVAGNLKAGVSKAVGDVRTNGLKNVLSNGVSNAKNGLATSVQNLGKNGLLRAVVQRLA